MRIYTKTGDEGRTGLYKGGRVSKASPRIEALGEIDEVNCLIGVCLQDLTAHYTSGMLERVQTDLMRMGGDLAAPGHEQNDAVSGKNSGFLRMNENDILQLEAYIDQMEEELPPLTTFILPGGSRVGANLHLCRAVCRRAERRCVELQETMGAREINPDVIKYLNRLSDFLFVLARTVNKDKGWPEARWLPRIEETV